MNTVGTLNMDTIVNTSALQPNSSAAMSIFESGGSNGNSTIFLPSPVKFPELSNAPNTHNWYIELRILSCGGGSMKSKSSKFAIPSDFKSNTTFPKFVL